MNDPVKTQVLVVGGGPVGLTLAMDLAQRGIRRVVAELRHKGEPPSVKCNHVSARSMEIFRRLGVAKAIREAGLPADYPNDVSYRVSFTGKELSRIPIPCRRDRYTATEVRTPGGRQPSPRIGSTKSTSNRRCPRTPRRSPASLCSIALRSIALNRRLRASPRKAPNSTAISRSRYRADFLVGCDGGRSAIRRAIGATLSGTAEVQRVQSTYIRAPSLLVMSELKPSMGYVLAQSRSLRQRLCDRRSRNMAGA